MAWRCLKVYALMLSVVLPFSVNGAEKLDKLVLSGPFAAVSNPLIRMVESGALSDIAEHVEFVTWSNPDQMRALTLNGDVDFMATPTNVAANLYNKGADIRLLNVSVWGALWLVSRDPSLRTLADFKGKEVLVPFRGDMPDIVFQQLLQVAGFDVANDYQVQYVATPLDAMQMLIMRRADHVLLAEPAVSMALRKTQSFPISLIAPELHRSVDLQAEWGRLMATQASIPQAGIALLNSDLDEQIVARFMREYAKASQWCLDNPAAAGQIVAERIDLLTPAAVADSIRHTQLRAFNAVDAQADLEAFFSMMHAHSPKLIGGQLPDQDFYYATAVSH